MSMFVIPEVTKYPVVLKSVLTLASDAVDLWCRCARRQETRVPCRGIDIEALPLSESWFRQRCISDFDYFVARTHVRGIEHVSKWGFQVHGPRLSYDYDAHMTDPGSSVFRLAQQPDKLGEVHPELTLSTVFERDPLNRPMVDYLLVGWFLMPEKKIRTSASWAGDRSSYQDLGWEANER